eukprot:tig00000704_g3332.t1
MQRAAVRHTNERVESAGDTPQTAPGLSNSDLNERIASMQRDAERHRKLKNKLEALAWIAGAVLVMNYSEFLDVIHGSPFVRRSWFNLGVAAFLGNTFLTMYVTVWLKYVRGVDNAWEAHFPKAVPISIGLGLTSFLCLLIGLWPVWGFMTLFIMLILTMAFFMSLHLLPEF